MYSYISYVCYSNCEYDSTMIKLFNSKKKIQKYKNRKKYEKISNKKKPTPIFGIIYSLKQILVQFN